MADLQEAPKRRPPTEPKPKTYSCYLLRSLHGMARGCVYIGFTVNPLRRLRQHNGEIKGGARKTSRFKPWEVVLVVHGFSNKIIALQFEYAWQHPERSRLLREGFREHLHRRRAAQLEAKLVVLSLALNTPPFSAQSLGAHPVPAVGESAPLPCALCASAIVRSAIACRCGLRSHPSCLALRFLPANDASVIPSGGLCPRCSAHVLWPDLVR
ncbi:hypothetical protein T492DRAFT_600437, partial [Pavlovales sp. CCMP2436]